MYRQRFRSKYSLILHCITIKQNIGNIRYSLKGFPMTSGSDVRSPMGNLAWCQQVR